MFLLDTNFLSEVRRGARPALDWIEPVDTSDLFISVITLGEIAKGVSLKSRRDRRSAEVLAGWLNTVRVQFGQGIIDVSDEIALEWGRLEAQRPRGPDGLIAATALVRGLTLVTRNTADFRDVPIDLIDPWTSA